MDANYSVIVAPKKYIDKFRQGDKEVLKQAKLVKKYPDAVLILAFRKRSKEDKSITDSDMEFIRNQFKSCKRVTEAVIVAKDDQELFSKLEPVIKNALKPVADISDNSSVYSENTKIWVAGEKDRK
ncbi:MAG: hypothetical protein KGH59_00265 [Candidatus Micrarchaeota archaeon]|nr:hypothetical protein [Candidatus Micrarchaeota archaeon]MDE1804207.1 hypothetical protein [Candidatus Micrarchaeota archaeon]MDE1846663.1 hypothetical protein [Candidatus Micrarchaeota archaeon]